MQRSPVSLSVRQLFELATTFELIMVRVLILLMLLAGVYRIAVRLFPIASFCAHR